MRDIIYNTLHSKPGTYALFLQCKQQKTIQIGKFGSMDLRTGFYIYIGSAYGPGGIRARVGRHLREHKTKRWHIDYLAAETQPIDVYINYDKRLEHAWAKKLAGNEKYNTPLKGFGASDCHCETHLFFTVKNIKSQHLHWMTDLS